MIKHLQPGKRLSGGTVHNGVVYLSGQVPEDGSASIKDQAAQVLAKIERLLAEAGTDKTHILSATVWLPSISDFASFNEVWDPWAPQPAPARACIESRLANPSFKVEIGVIAALPGS